MQRGILLKRENRSMVLVSLLMVVLVLLAGCAPRATSGQLAANADESQIVVDLPALVLDVQPDGSLNVGGQPLAQLGGGIAAGLASVTIPADMVTNITTYNIQHIQIDNTPEGLLILVNGQPIPSLAWDGDKLVSTAEVLEDLGSGVTLLDKVLPLITDVGIGVIFRFPLAEGEEALPMVSTDNTAAEAAMKAQQEFLDAVKVPPTFAVTITYAKDGTWSVAGLGQSDLSQLPIPTDQLNLPTATLAQLSAAGISEIGLATNTDGIFISINGKTLPYITWADGRINHLISLAEETGLLSTMTNGSSDVTAIIDTVESLLPAVQASNVSVRVTFP